MPDGLASRFMTTGIPVRPGSLPYRVLFMAVAGGFR